MGGHRRDQSDSHMPLKQCSDLHRCASTDSHELRVRVDSTHSVLEQRLSNGIIISSRTGTDICPTITDTYSQQRIRTLWRKEVLKTVVAFFCMLLSAFLNFFLLTVIHDIVPRQPLPDLVFMVIPQQRWAWAVGDVLSTVSSVVGFICVFMHKERVVVLRRVLLLGAIMYGLRAVVLGVTFLPPSFHNRDDICQPQVNRTAMYAMEVATRFMTYVVTLGLTSGQEKILCGDLMFSGHTVVLTIMYFTQLQYTPKGLVLLRYIATPITFLGIAALVVSGGHYTMDVLIAYWLTSHVFWGYHQIFEMPKSERTNAPMSRLWWFWLCCWFENDVADGPMKNEWNWPFGRPIFMRNLIAYINDKLQ
uniref:Sphingomyelin synthase-like domain-containing protein n=2 Tax=Parascaris TaxID=6254 RepID=A0A915BHB3_PARUN